jgi:hypothetical protein
MTNIPTGPFYLNMFYKRVPAEPVSERTPAFRNIHFSDITVKGAPVAGYILGLPEMPVENITFSNINIDAEQGFSCKDAKNIAFYDVRVNTKKGPALICENVEDLEIEGFRTLAPHADCAVIDLKNVTTAYLRGCRATTGVATFLEVSGPSSRDILLQGNDLRKASVPVKTEEGLPAATVVRE